MRVTARWVLPVLVGPRSAVIWLASVTGAKVGRRLSGRARLRRSGLPVGGVVILEEQTRLVLSREDSGEDGIADAGGAVDDVERWVEAVDRDLARGDVGRI